MLAGVITRGDCFSGCAFFVEILRSDGLCRY